ncbi:MAG: class I SAM-dependent methyltransferase [Spirochaetaceae bacterium]|jgi:23S rRNA U2552 (ribose-2'-O)-methylase RlmE/FtsJ|nr:class I SAM-dependent methyltransferase [Spirochaetaceae bacterium]
MESYEEVFKNHNGFVSHKWVHYFYIYDKLFWEYRQKNLPLTIMEIGVDRGGSLEIWKKYLPEGSKIYGVDINPQCEKINFSENIFFHLGSAADRAFMEKTFAGLEFDIILDDGSHICSDVIETFKIMFPRIKAGGLYVVEDLHTSYWGNYGGGCRKKGSSIEYFKNFVEALNADYIHSFGSLRLFSKYLSRNFKDNVKQVLKKNVVKKYFSGIDYSKSIEALSFYDSICAIKKFACPKDGSFKSVISGNENIGEVNCFRNEEESIQKVKRMFLG